jgi:vacuolar-type H+-ATPase subunit I/STV1
MCEELKEIVELTDAKADAIKQYTKEVKETLEEQIELKKHEKQREDQLKEVMSKNAELITKTEKVIRLNANEVLWIDKTYTKVNTIEVDKLTPEKKTEYEVLKKELELKTKQLKDIEASVTKIEDKLQKTRVVIMKHAATIVSSTKVIADDLSAIIMDYDEMNNMMAVVIDSIRAFINWIGQSIGSLFGK